MDGFWRTPTLERGFALFIEVGKSFTRPREPQGATIIADVAHKKVLRRLSVDELLPKQVRFADSGKAVCAAAGIQRDKYVPVKCLDADTGALIAEAANVKRGWTIATAKKSTRIVINQYREVPEDRPATPELERRVVWDYRTGQQLADWIPESQKWQYPIGDMNLARSNRFAFAISPTGRYIAEGGNGVLRLYEIEP